MRPIARMMKYKLGLKACTDSPLNWEEILMDRCQSCQRRPGVAHHLHRGYCTICWRRLKTANYAAFSRKG